MSTLKTLSLAIPLIALACTHTPEPVTNAVSGIVRSVSEEVITSGTPVTFADLKIDGMSCEMMCGSAIKQALAGLPGVEKTTIQFHEGEDADHAIVTYDESKITDEQMIEAVQQLHGGSYKVLAVSITKQVKGETPASGQPAEKESAQVSASLPEVIIPGLLELLSQISRL